LGCFPDFGLLLSRRMSSVAALFQPSNIVRDARVFFTPRMYFRTGRDVLTSRALSVRERTVDREIGDCDFRCPDPTPLDLWEKSQLSSGQFFVEARWDLGRECVFQRQVFLRAPWNVSCVLFFFFVHLSLRCVRREC